MANKRGWWSLTITNSDDDEYIKLSDCDREHIGKSIKEGYTQGEIVQDEPEEEEVE